MTSKHWVEQGSVVLLSDNEENALVNLFISVLTYQRFSVSGNDMHSYSKCCYATYNESPDTAFYISMRGIDNKISFIRICRWSIASYAVNHMYNF